MGAIKLPSYQTLVIIRADALWLEETSFPGVMIIENSRVLREFPFVQGTLLDKRRYSHF